MGKASTPTTNNAVAYYRVSTKRQGESGLGLEAQQASVQQFARANGLTIVAEFTEIETGTTKRNRPILAQAIDRTKAEHGRLLIAKLDRLSRSVAFTASLRDAGVPFTAVDMPDMNELVVNIIAAVNQDEAQRISQRTKAALQAAKARGVKLGNPQNLTPEARAKGPQSKRDEARDAYAEHLDYIRMMRAQKMSLRAIAERLNKHHTTRGDSVNQPSKFTAATVQRILKRAEMTK